MNIGSVSSHSGSCDTQRTNSFKTIREDFKSLQSALKSGDLKAAQDAYAKLKQDLPAPKNASGSSSGGSGSGSSSFSTDLDAIGSALQSGDLSGAQKAFATFQQDAQAARGANGARGAHGHHHHHDSDGDGDDATTSSTSTTTGLTANGLNAQA